MVRKIKVRFILEHRFQGMSMNEIFQTRGISKHSVCRTCSAAKGKTLTFSDVKDMTDDALYHLLFPENHCNEDVFEKWDINEASPPQAAGYQPHKSNSICPS